jgi:hypothetical protein
MKGRGLVDQIHWLSWIEVLEGVLVDGFGVRGILNKEGVDSIRCMDDDTGAGPADSMNLTHDPEESLRGYVLNDVGHVDLADAAVL